MTLRLALLPLALLLLATAACADSPDAPPKPIQAMQERGVKIIGQFDSQAGLTGYAGLINQRPVAIYVTGDGQHAVVGYMINDKGELVDRDTLEQMVVEPMSRRLWSRLEQSTWVPDGDADADRVVYVFTDPNCPYCHLFFQRARRWVQSGKVQLRHVLVGIISESSPNKAATILAADDPEQAYLKNEHQFSEGGVTAMQDIPDAISRQLAANLKLMRQLGLNGTPGIVYRNADGHVQIQAGVPRKKALPKVLGPR